MAIELNRDSTGWINYWTNAEAKLHVVCTIKHDHPTVKVQRTAEFVARLNDANLCLEQSMNDVRKSVLSVPRSSSKHVSIGNWQLSSTSKDSCASKTQKRRI